MNLRDRVAGAVVTGIGISSRVQVDDKSRRRVNYHGELFNRFFVSSFGRVLFLLFSPSHDMLFVCDLNLIESHGRL